MTIFAEGGGDRQERHPKEVFNVLGGMTKWQVEALPVVA
jgi:hypothetical protein